MNGRRSGSASSRLRFLTCGSVDDGKSTLIGRLISESSGIYDDQLNSLRDDSRRFGSVGDDIDFALLLDGLEAERAQGITIDVAYRFFSTPKRSFVVADAPGHEQYTRNMATAASNSELAVVLVDARSGIVRQTRRHMAIVSMFGIRHVVLAINKMDLVEFSERRFLEIQEAFQDLSLNQSLHSMTSIPLSALVGDNVVGRSSHMAWYVGPTLLAHLETVDTVEDRRSEPLRFPVQWVNRPNSDFRGYSGTVASGRVGVGDKIVVSASGQVTQVARIVTFDGDVEIAGVGRSVTLVLKDQIDIGRGDLLADPRHRPVVSRRFAADIVWLDDMKGIIGDSYLLKMGTATVPVTLTRVMDLLNIENLERTAGQEFDTNAIGRAELETVTPLAFDPYDEVKGTGAFILIDRHSSRTLAGGMMLKTLNVATNVHYQSPNVTAIERAAIKNQTPAVVWFTGLPSSGKSTIANLLERMLVTRGCHTMLLDGDNLRHGLSTDLGFDAVARSENVRRVGELAKLMVEAGLIVLVALVSPFRSDRARAAALVPQGQFLEIFVDTPIEICRARDPKGLYEKADHGGVQNLTGRDQAYEPPLHPALTLRTAEMTADECAERVLTRLLPLVQRTHDNGSVRQVQEE